MLSIQELHSSTSKELQLELTNANNELLKLRMGIKTKNTKDTSLYLKQRHYIAQIKTVINDLKLESMVKDAVEVK